MNTTPSGLQFDDTTVGDGKQIVVDVPVIRA